MVLEIKPDQVTLVPDGPDVITSCAGWDTIQYQQYLKPIIKQFKNKGIRVSIFVDPIISMIEAAKLCGTDRIELYTENYANQYNSNKEQAIEPYILAAEKATEIGLEINAGHDLNLENLAYFSQNIKNLDEVSIGHALISDALYLGLENTVHMYKRLL
jgi:pyridoxine 5-phosphate synthase